MSPNESDGNALAEFNRRAEVQRNRALFHLVMEEILIMVRDGEDDAGDLREKCERAIPLWLADLEARRAAYAACGHVRPEQPADAMANLILRAGAAGKSPAEIQRLQEPLWPLVHAWVREHQSDVPGRGK